MVGGGDHKVSFPPFLLPLSPPEEEEKEEEEEEEE